MARFQFIVQEFELFSSEADFWEVYKNPKGGKMGYQHILDELKIKRRASISDSFGDDAAAARAYFGGDLGRADANDAFKYKKSGRAEVYEKDKDVAIRWHKLLEHNSEIRAKWEAMSK